MSRKVSHNRDQEEKSLGSTEVVWHECNSAQVLKGHAVDATVKPFAFVLMSFSPEFGDVYEM